MSKKNIVKIEGKKDVKKEVKKSDVKKEKINKLEKFSADTKKEIEGKIKEFKVPKILYSSGEYRDPTSSGKEGFYKSKGEFLEQKISRVTKYSITYFTLLGIIDSFLKAKEKEKEVLIPPVFKTPYLAKGLSKKIRGFIPQASEMSISEFTEKCLKTDNTGNYTEGVTKLLFKKV